MSGSIACTRTKRTGLALFFASLALAGCAAQTAEAQNASLDPPAILEARRFTPAPPETGSAVERAELGVLRGPWSDERRRQAIEDNALDPFAAFGSVLGPDFNAINMPATRAVLQRSMLTAGYGAEPVKSAYRRLRPFLSSPDLNHCFPEDHGLREGYSYPSGHAAIGFAWSLVLAELAPSRADALIERGRDFGWSRVVCGVHYPTDVDAGRVIGAAAVARLHADSEFRRDMEAARQEIASHFGLNQ